MVSKPIHDLAIGDCIAVAVGATGRKHEEPLPEKVSEQFDFGFGKVMLLE